MTVQASLQALACQRRGEGTPDVADVFLRGVAYWLHPAPQGACAPSGDIEIDII
jgi:hypothetical protein